MNFICKCDFAQDLKATFAKPRLSFHQICLKYRHNTLSKYNSGFYICVKHFS